MRGDCATPRAAGLAVLVCGACLACRLAAAEPLPVNFDVQYQRIESPGETREFWSRNLDLTYTRRLSPQLQLASQFRLNTLDYIGRPERSFTPFGSLQLMHPFAGFAASYRPHRSTNSEDVTTRQKEAQFTGFVAPPNLPRFDVQWTRRRQEPGDRVPAGTGITRSGRLTWLRGGLELRGGAGDLTLESDDATTRTTSQRDWDAGAGYRLARRGWTMHADVGLGDVRRGAGVERDVNRTRSGLFEFMQRIGPRANANLTYQYRGIEAGREGHTRMYGTHDGAAMGVFRPTRATQLQLGGGVRPVTLLSGSTRTLGYLFASATAQGRVRAGWTGVASAAQTLNRNPDGHSYRVGSYRAGSRFILARGLHVDLDGTVTANGDTAARDQRTTSLTSAGVTANPLRRISFAWNVRGYRTGRDLAHASARSTSQTFDVRWQPANALELGANVGRSGVLPKGDPTLTTKRYSIRFQPGARFQADLQYASSDQSRTDLGRALAGREVWSGRALVGLGRRFRVSAGGAVTDPGQATRTRQADVTVSARLGGAS